METVDSNTSLLEPNVKYALLYQGPALFLNNYGHISELSVDGIIFSIYSLLL